MALNPYIPPAYLSSLPAGIWSGVSGLPVLPYLPGQMMSVTKAPTWSTLTARSASGRVRKTAMWPYPIWEFELSYEVIRHRPTNDELATLWEFFGVAAGQYGQWLFVDPTDCQVLNQALTDQNGNAILDQNGNPITDGGSGFGTGDGVTTTFQLSRRLNSLVEPVFAVFDPTILDNGAVAGPYTISGGQVIFATPPAAGHALSWYGYFYFGAEFTQDDMTLDAIVQTLWSGKSLKFRSLRV